MSGAIGSIIGAVGGYALGGPAGAAIGGSLGGALGGADAAENAANAQIQAGQQANDLQYQMFNQSRADQAPWREAGVEALNQLRTGIQPGGNLMRSFSMSDYQADPGYGFRLAEGMKSLERSAAARGNLLSGGALKGITRYGQDMASNEYQNAYNRYTQNQTNQYNRLAGVAGTGQNAAQQIGQQGMQMGQNVGNTLQGIGNARASGYVGGANALTGGIGQAYNLYNQGQMVNALRGGGGGYGGMGYPSGFGTGTDMTTDW